MLETSLLFAGFPGDLAGSLHKEGPSFGSLRGGSVLNGVLEEGKGKAVIIPLCLISLMQMSLGSGEEGGTGV